MAAITNVGSSATPDVAHSEVTTEQAGGTASTPKVDTTGLSPAAAAGMEALAKGPEAMKAWIESQLGSTPGQRDFKVKVEAESYGGMSRAVVSHWKELTGKVMKELSPEARKQYEAMLNTEMRNVLQGAMLGDMVMEEQRSMSFTEFSATGKGAKVTVKQDKKIAEAAISLYNSQNDYQIHYTETSDKIAERHGSTSVLGSNGRIDFKFLSSLKNTQSSGAEMQAKAAVTPPQLRIDMASVSKYTQAKMSAANEYVEKHNIGGAQKDAAVAILVSPRYAREYVRSKLERFSVDENHIDSVENDWNALKGTLHGLPDDLKQRYIPVANEGFQISLLGAFKYEQEAGHGTRDVISKFFAMDEAKAPEIRFWLKEDGTLGKEVYVKMDCVNQVILPAIAMILTIIPATTAIGIAMTCAMALNSAIETGNWLGAAVSIVGSLVGMGGVGNVVGSAASASSGILGTISSGISAVTKAIGGVMSAIPGVSLLNSALIDISKTIVGGVGDLAGNLFGEVGKSLATNLASTGVGKVGSSLAGTIGKDLLGFSDGANSFLPNLFNAGERIGNVYSLSKSIERGDVFGAIGSGIGLAANGLETHGNNLKLAGNLAGTQDLINKGNSFIGMSSAMGIFSGANALAKGVEYKDPFQMTAGALNIAGSANVIYDKGFGSSATQTSSQNTDDKPKGPSLVGTAIKLANSGLGLSNQAYAVATGRGGLNANNLTSGILGVASTVSDYVSPLSQAKFTPDSAKLEGLSDAAKESALAAQKADFLNKNYLYSSASPFVNGIQNGIETTKTLTGVANQVQTFI